MSKVIGAKDFSGRLMAWYREHARALPWRQRPVAYNVWLSEIILQQTKVAQGLPYYVRFIEAFPTIYDLARASEQEVLRLWQGLGYYRRGVNLLRCAREVVERYGGEFPRGYDELCRLPGIGPYTAAAVASIAFDEAVAVVDGNVYRVLARIFGIRDDIGGSGAQRRFKEQAEVLLDREQPGVFNQALMEFGALHCVPAGPDCGSCIFGDVCVAKREDLQSLLPVKSRKKPLRDRYFHYVIFRCGDALYMRRRGDRDVWYGLYDFYLVERERFYDFEELDDAVVRGVYEAGVDVRVLLPHYKHVLSHQRIHVAFFCVDVDAEWHEGLTKYSLKLFSLYEVGRLPVPIVIANFLKKSPSLVASKVCPLSAVG